MKNSTLLLLSLLLSPSCRKCTMFFGLLRSMSLLCLISQDDCDYGHVRVTYHNDRVKVASIGQSQSALRMEWNGSFALRATLVAIWTWKLWELCLPVRLQRSNILSKTVRYQFQKYSTIGRALKVITRESMLTRTAALPT